MKEDNKSKATEKTALITGATSGIGKAFAEEFARRGYELIITGRREDIIKSVAIDIEREHKVSVKVIIAELSQDKGIQKVIREIRSCASLVALVNNAGFGHRSVFLKESVESHLDMINVHVTAAIRCIHEALPRMIELGEGTIINVSSMSAWVPGPTISTYGGTKAFLAIFSESLHVELRKKGIRVQALCPGFTSTDFHKRLGMEDDFHVTEAIAWMKPGEVVRESMEALGRGDVICVPGFRKRLIAWLLRRVPRKLLYDISEREFRKLHGDV